MLKLLETSAFYKETEPSISILNLTGPTSGLEKSAAHEDISAFIATLDPKPGHTYLHINAMTAGEYHGSNRNGDFFPEENLKAYYKTFETSPAYVYRGHVNKDPARSYGKVIFATYNNRMHRVELVCECPDDLIKDVTSRIGAGDYPTTSMACKTPADTCSICGNVAHSRAEYCKHLRSELNKLHPDGKKTFAINNKPLSFFDISIVIRPADVNSSVLRKIADSEVVGSLELAELEGLNEKTMGKQAEFKKLSELIKEITDGCYVVGAGKSTTDILGRSTPSDLPMDLIDRLHHFDISKVLASLATVGISPSIRFLSELVARNKFGDDYVGIGEVVQDFIKEIPHSEEIPLVKFEESTEPSELVLASLIPFIETSSVFSSAVEKRASNVGYSGNGPHVEPNAKDMYEESIRSSGVDGFGNISYTKLLLGLGGAALLAKFYITSQIEKKMREQELRYRNNVKIDIVKRASDIVVTTRLAKMAMVESLPPRRKQDDSLGIVDTNKIGLSITKRILNRVNPRIGSKLSNLMRIFSVGEKVSNLGQ